MLKVNLRKNFAQDFADKYGLTKRQVGFRVSDFIYNRAFSNGYISVVFDVRGEAVLQITPIFIPMLTTKCPNKNIKYPTQKSVSKLLAPCSA